MDAVRYKQKNLIIVYAYTLEIIYVKVCIKKFRASLFTDDLQPCHICGGTVYVLRGVGYYYVKSSRCHKHSDDPEFKPTLNDEDIYFFDSTIEEEGPNRSDFIRYFTYYKIITG